MKRTFNILLAGLLLGGFTACEGNGNDDDNNNGDIQGPFTLSVEKSEIEANGKDEAKFVLTDANGNILTNTQELNYIVFENTATGNKIEQKTRSFTAVKNGTYTFKARYKKTDSENTVTVTAKNRHAYEKYFRKIAAFDITNVHCGYCPVMAAALEGTDAEWKQHMTILAVHGPFDSRDPFIIGSMANDLLATFIGSGMYPSCIFNLTYSMAGAGDAKPSFIAGVIEDQLRDYPATCGVRINSTYADNKITIDAAMTSSTGGKYELGFALLMDKGMYAGGTAADNIYNDIVMAVSNNYMSMTSDATTVTANQEITKTFSMDKVNITAENLKNYRVVVFALRSNGDKTIIDNLAECALGGSIGYVENE